MSWNISTRLNNLQQQINNIANKGLTNPLEQILDANNYSLTNLNILDSGSNILELQSSNVGGITTNCDFTADGDITCQILNYDRLNPPINPNGITFDILGGNASETSMGNFSLTNYNPYNGIITRQYVLNPSLQLTLNFSNIDSSNSFAFGYSSTNNLYPTGGFNAIEYGIYYYPNENTITQIANGQTTIKIFPYSNKQQIQVSLKIIENNLKVFINNEEVTILEQSITEGLYYVVSAGYMGTTTVTSLTDVVVGQTSSETLSQVLSNGNDGGGQSITGINALTCNTLNYQNLNPAISTEETLSQVLTNGNDGSNQSITGINALTCNTLNYTTLNPPITGGGENLQQTLTIGNSAGGLSISNVGTITSDYTVTNFNSLTKGYLQIGKDIGNSSNLMFLYGDGTSTGNNYSFVAFSDIITLQEYKNNALYWQPLYILDKSVIQLNTANLLVGKNDGTINPTNTGYVIDSINRPPMYKQIYNGVTGTTSGLIISPKILLSTLIYTQSTYTNTLYGVNYGEILFTNLALTFSLQNGGTMPSNCNATLFLSSTGTGAYDSTLSNNLIISLTSGGATSTFNSTVPIILYVNSTTQFNKIYLMISFNKIPAPPATSYITQVNNANMVVSGYITSNQSSTINFGS